MKSKYNYLFYLAFIIFILLVINCNLHNSPTYVEKFTPGIRQIYRPYFRNFRTFMTSKFDTISSKAHNFMKRVNLK